MSFFNKKEQVIKIDLTQYGKIALSQGAFRPCYYAFYDDDVFYDSRYSHPNVSEPQNDIQDRIIDSARLMPQSIIYGAETKLAEVNALGQQHDGVQQISPNNFEKNLLLRNSLYDTEPGEQGVPKFHIYLSEPGAEFDLDSGVSKSMGNFIITEVDNIKCTINMIKKTTLPYEEPGALSQEEFRALYEDTLKKSKPSSGWGAFGSHSWAGFAKGEKTEDCPAGLYKKDGECAHPKRDALWLGAKSGENDDDGASGSGLTPLGGLGKRSKKEGDK